MRVVAAFAIVCACLLIFGGLTVEQDRLAVSAISEPALLTVVVTFSHVTDAYRWLSVHGCAADVTETGTYCIDGYESQSSVELSGRKQELFHWRRVPRGTFLITAMAFDADHKLLASGRRVVFR